MGNKVIGLVNLQGFYLKLDGNFKRAVFTEAHRRFKSWKEVAKRFGITDSGLRWIRNLKDVKAG